MHSTAEHAKLHAPSGSRSQCCSGDVSQKISQVLDKSDGIRPLRAGSNSDLSTAISLPNLADAFSPNAFLDNSLGLIVNPLTNVPTFEFDLERLLNDGCPLFFDQTSNLSTAQPTSTISSAPIPGDVDGSHSGDNSDYTPQEPIRASRSRASPSRCVFSQL